MIKITFLILMSFSLSAYEGIIKIPIKYYSANAVKNIVNEYLVNDDLDKPISGVTANLVFYDSENADGNPIVASGILLTPLNCVNATVVSLQHSTVFSDRNAPSVNLISSIFWGNHVLHYNLLDAFVLASQGNIVVMSDYTGFGASSNLYQSYLDYRMEAIVSADLLKAMSYSGYSGPLFLSGYSQGGHATLALLDYLQQNPIGSFEVIGSAAGAAPHSLSTIINVVLGFDLPGANIFFALLITGAKENYHWDRNYSDIFKDPYDRLFPNIMNGSNNWDEVELKLPDLPSDLFTESFINGVLLQQDQELLSIIKDTTSIIPQTPILLWHSFSDTIVPVFNTQVAFQSYDSQGSDVILDITDTGDHLDDNTLDSWTHAVLDMLNNAQLANDG